MYKDLDFKNVYWIQSNIFLINDTIACSHKRRLCLKSTQTTRLITYYYATSRIKVIPNITNTDYKIKS